MGSVLSFRISCRKSSHFFVARTKNIRIALHIFLMQKTANPHEYKESPQPQGLRVFHLYGGAEGSRTPEKRFKNRMNTWSLIFVLKFISKIISFVFGLYPGRRGVFLPSDRILPSCFLLLSCPFGQGADKCRVQWSCQTSRPYS